MIPFLVISSYYIAVTLDQIYDKLINKSSFMQIIAVGGCVFILSVNSIWFTNRWYYRTDLLRLNAAEYINSNTNENSLVINSIEDTDPRDPRILAPSLRYGWSVDLKYLKGEVIDSLKGYGAQYLAIILNNKPDSSLTSYLSKYKSTETVIYKKDWLIRIYTLQ
jgi:hypothetical protein